MKTSDPSYCGKRFVEPPRHPNSKHPYSPEDSSSEASENWLKFASFYTPCSIQFNSYPHLVQLMKSTNLSSVYECNKNVRQYILKHKRKVDEPFQSNWKRQTIPQVNQWFIDMVQWRDILLTWFYSILSIIFVTWQILVNSLIVVSWKWTVILFNSDSIGNCILI